MAEEQNPQAELKIDRSNLYREETFTDLKVGMIKRMTPVKSDGADDKMPLQAVIQAKDLQQAIKKFPEAMKVAMDRLAEEAKKYQQQEQSRAEKSESRIIVPGR
jgi:hypothetical protein